MPDAYARNLTPEAAVDRLEELHVQAAEALRRALARFVDGGPPPDLFRLWLPWTFGWTLKAAPEGMPSGTALGTAWALPRYGASTYTRPFTEAALPASSTALMMMSLEPGLGRYTVWLTMFVPSSTSVR